jgi:hypothetical protein
MIYFLYIFLISFVCFWFSLCKSSYISSYLLHNFTSYSFNLFLYPNHFFEFDNSSRIDFIHFSVSAKLNIIVLVFICLLAKSICCSIKSICFLARYNAHIPKTNQNISWYINIRVCNWVIGCSGNIIFQA